MKRLSILILSLTSSLLFSQVNTNKCITTKLVTQEMLSNKDYKDARHNIVKPNTNIEKSTITIPVVIHIIHRQSHSNIGTGTNISNAQIEDALRILNEDFSKTNPEFPSPPRNTFNNYWGNPDIEFCLATTDPNGNSTSGIIRTATSQSNWNADDDDDTDPCHEANGMKKTSCGGKDGWDPKRYLNIWICDLINSSGMGMTLGYAYLPGLLANPFNTSDDYKDGLVVDYRYFGTIGIAAASSDGRTATHEIGHYLGLMHTFCEQTDNQGNLICCDNDNNIFGGFVDDTPATKDIYFGPVTSSTNNNTCNDLSYSNAFNTNVLDMDENFMAYSANTWMFSQGQVDAMLNVLNRTESNAGRLSLKNSSVTTNCSGIISGTSEIPLHNINIYPNPTNGLLNITSSENINAISICNIIGKQVLNTENKRAINISSLEDGIYFINITTEKGIYTERIILAK